MFFSPSHVLSKKMVRAMTMAHTILIKHHRTEPPGGPQQNPFGPRYEDGRMIIYGGPFHPNDEEIMLEVIGYGFVEVAFDHAYAPGSPLHDFSTYDEKVLDRIYEHLSDVYDRCMESNVYPMHYARSLKHRSFAMAV